MNDWEEATFEGVERARERAVASVSPERRLAWLEDVLQLAAASGALRRARDARQRACDDAWGRGTA